MKWVVRVGDVSERLRQLPDTSVQCVVTSPPYWGLRDYGTAGQIGLERTPEEYVAKLVAVFAEVRRVLRGDGTVWLNLGDSYGAGGGKQVVQTKNASHGLDGMRGCQSIAPKQLAGIPWRVAFALQADGWYLRSDIIWAKPNPMPESVTDRPTKSHEYLFLLTKSARYYFDQEAVREDWTCDRDDMRAKGVRTGLGYLGGAIDNSKADAAFGAGKRTSGESPSGRNIRTVWTIATQPFPEAHFATFPEALVEPCIKAGSKQDDTVLDPFAGSGTTGVVALKLGRSFVGIELNPTYAEMARRRVGDVAPLLALEEAS